MIFHCSKSREMKRISMESPPLQTSPWIAPQLASSQVKPAMAQDRCCCFSFTVPNEDACEPRPFEINGSSVCWPDLDADIGAEGLLAGAGEHPYYARKSEERAVRMGRLPASALKSRAPAGLRSA